MRIILLMIFLSACSSLPFEEAQKRWENEIKAERYLINSFVNKNLLTSKTTFIRKNIIKNIWQSNPLKLTKIKSPIKHGLWLDPWPTMLGVANNGCLWFFNPNLTKSNDEKINDELIGLSRNGQIIKRKYVECFYTVFSLSNIIVIFGGGVDSQFFDLHGEELCITNYVDETKSYKKDAKWDMFYYVENNEIKIYQEYYADKINRDENDTNKYKMIEQYVISGTNYSVTKHIETYTINPKLYKKTFTNIIYNSYKDLRGTRFFYIPYFTADVDKFGNYYLQSKTNQGHPTQIQKSGEIDVFNRHGKKLFTFKYPKDYPFVIQTRTAVSKNGVIYILYYNEKGVFIDKFVPDYLYKKHNGDLSKCI